jgi:hypothetical protein
MNATSKKLLPAIIFVLGLYACSSSKVSEQNAVAATGAWQTNMLVIDGNDSDWAGNLLFYDQKSDLGYSISSDRAYLYILLRTSNEHTQQQILRGGLTVLFNTHGVKDEHGAAGISYPTGNLHQKNSPLSGKSELNTNKNSAIANAKDYSLFGFMQVQSVGNYDIGKENAAGIEVNIGLNNSGALVYEAAVPFTALFNQSGAVNAPGRNIAVGFVIDDIPSEQGRGNGGRGGGISFGGGFGLGGFGSGGGMGLSIGTGALGGGGRQGGGGLKQTRIWKEVVLAKVK